VKAADSRLLGDELRPRNGRVVVGDVGGDEFDGEAVGVAEGEDGFAEPFDAVVVVDAVVVEALLPVVEAALGHAEGRPRDLTGTDLPAGHPLPREEGHARAGRPLSVGEKEVVGRGVVLVDRALDQSETERLDPEVHVLLGVARDTGDVVDARCRVRVCHYPPIGATRT
jgi:hypothetical protein